MIQLREVDRLECRRPETELIDVNTHRWTLPFGVETVYQYEYTSCSCSGTSLWLQAPDMAPADTNAKSMRVGAMAVTTTLDALTAKTVPGLLFGQ